MTQVKWWDHNLSSNLSPSNLWSNLNAVVGGIKVRHFLDQLGNREDIFEDMKIFI